MRLIDADKLKRKCQKVATEAWKMKIKASAETIMNQFIDFIDETDTVDAVEVVRCKDCKYRSTEDNVWVCPFGLPGGPEFFCGYGVDGKDGDYD